MATTYERLKKIVVEQLGVEEDEVKPEASFVDDLNADSLDLVELIMSLEEEFGTEISDEDAEKIRTVQDAVDYIDERVDLAPRPAAIGDGSGATGSRARGAARPPRPRPRPPRAGARPQQLAPRAPRRGARPQRAPRVPRRRRHQPRDLRGPVRAPTRPTTKGCCATRRASIVVDDRPRPPGRTGSTSGRTCRSARARPSAAAGDGRRCSPRPSRRSPAPSTSTSAGTSTRDLADDARRARRSRTTRRACSLKSPKSRLQEYTQRRTGGTARLPRRRRDRARTTRSSSRSRSGSRAASRGRRGAVAAGRRDRGRRSRRSRRSGPSGRRASSAVGEAASAARRPSPADRRARGRR